MRDGSVQTGKARRMRILFPITIVFCALVVASSVGGIGFEKEIYALDRPYMIAQIASQDIASLALLVPTLLISVLFMRRGSHKAAIVWLGTTVFMFYVFTTYGFTLRFNHLFLVYCFAFGLSFYMTVVGLLTIDAESIRGRFSPKAKTLPSVVFLAIVGIAMSVFWLANAIPSSISGALPEYAVLNGYTTSPIHLLDLGIFFPGCIISAVLLRKKHALGYLLAPSFLVFTVIMTSCLLEQTLALKLRGFEVDPFETAIFSTVFVVGGAILFQFMRSGAGARADST